MESSSISALNTMADLEEQVAIESGRWTKKKAALLAIAKAFSIPELEAMRSRMIAAADAEERGTLIDASRRQRTSNEQQATAKQARVVLQATPNRPSRAAPRAGRPAVPTIQVYQVRREAGKVLFPFSNSQRDFFRTGSSLAAHSTRFSARTSSASFNLAIRPDVEPVEDIQGRGTFLANDLQTRHR
jgi:hypothetical protein